MDLHLVFADSELAGAELAGGRLTLKLPAVQAWRLDGAPPGKPVVGWSRGVRIELDGIGAHVDTAFAGWGRITEGRLRSVAGWQSRVALPSSVDGGVELELDFGHRGLVLLRAHTFACRFGGEANHAESLFC